MEFKIEDAPSSDVRETGSGTKFIRTVSRVRGACEERLELVRGASTEVAKLVDLIQSSWKDAQFLKEQIESILTCYEEMGQLYTHVLDAMANAQNDETGRAQLLSATETVLLAEDCLQDVRGSFAAIHRSEHGVFLMPLIEDPQGDERKRVKAAKYSQN